MGRPKNDITCVCVSVLGHVVLMFRIFNFEFGFVNVSMSNEYFCNNGKRLFEFTIHDIINCCFGGQ